MEKIKQISDKIASFIESYRFDGTPAQLYEPVSYTIKQSGKRLRPMLCLLACDLFGGDTENALYPALALETFHNFTLIHDDIMDNAPVRRGKPTVFKKWGSNQAILSGDVMFAKAIELSLKSPVNPNEIARLVTRVSCEVCEGQQLDMDFETRNDVSVEEYLEMIRLKTAVLLATALDAGSVCANASAKDRQLIYDFGINIGIAFQLQDDLLDCYGNQDVFGKAIGGDIIENKKTYLYLKALELASDSDRATLKSIFSGERQLDNNNKIVKVKAIYDKVGIKETTENAIRQYFSTSYSIMGQIDAPEDKKTTLLAYADILLKREK